MSDNLRERWLPAEWDTADAAALQALAAGEALPEQQKRALRWIVETAGMAYEETFVPGESDIGHYLQGRRSVGLQIVKLLKVSLNALRQAADKPQPARKRNS
jgi:uncharacterized membrane protein